MWGLVSLKATRSHEQNGTHRVEDLQSVVAAGDEDASVEHGHASGAATRAHLCHHRPPVGKGPKNNAASNLGPAVPLGMQEVSGWGETHLSVSGE